MLARQTRYAPGHFHLQNKTKNYKATADMLNGRFDVKIFLLRNDTCSSNCHVTFWFWQDRPAAAFPSLSMCSIKICPSVEQEEEVRFRCGECGLLKLYSPVYERLQLFLSGSNSHYYT